MSNKKKFFFNKEDKAIKELLENEKMNFIIGGLEEYKRKVIYYERATTYTESTDTYRRF
jgi:hypothetical protein